MASTFIRCKPQGGNTYAYRVTQKYDPETKRSRHVSSEYLGMVIGYDFMNEPIIRPSKSESGPKSPPWVLLANHFYPDNKPDAERDLSVLLRRTWESPGSVIREIVTEQITKTTDTIHEVAKKIRHEALRATSFQFMFRTTFFESVPRPQKAADIFKKDQDHETILRPVWCVVVINREAGVHTIKLHDSESQAHGTPSNSASTIPVRATADLKGSTPLQYLRKVDRSVVFGYEWEQAKALRTLSEECRFIFTLDRLILASDSVDVSKDGEALIHRFRSASTNIETTLSHLSRSKPPASKYDGRIDIDVALNTAADIALIRQRMNDMAFDPA